MSDLLKACDFGVVSHITANLDFNKSYNPSDFYTVSFADILQKITAFSCELSERDFEFALTKPLLPSGFKIKPDGMVAKKNPLHNQPVTQSHFTISPSVNNFSVNQNNDDTITALQIKITEAETLASQATDLSSLKHALSTFNTMLDSQKLAIQTLFYDDADNIDILWINESVSFDDDRNNGIMSDNSGQMIVDLCNSLGYVRNKLNNSKQIGYTAFSFWAVNDNRDAQEYKMCLPFIKRLIYILNPKKVILSGNIPLYYLFQKEDIFEHHGQKNSLIINDKVINCYSVFNSSHIMCSEIAKKLFWFDLLKILHDNT